jgi:hypothetical protein
MIARSTYFIIFNYIITTTGVLAFFVVVVIMLWWKRQRDELLIVHQPVQESDIITEQVNAQVQAPVYYVPMMYTTNYRTE